jgi:hypothetical protein
MVAAPCYEWLTVALHMPCAIMQHGHHIHVMTCIWTDCCLLWSVFTLCTVDLVTTWTAERQNSVFRYSTWSMEAAPLARACVDTMVTSSSSICGTGSERCLALVTWELTFAKLYISSLTFVSDYNAFHGCQGHVNTHVAIVRLPAAAHSQQLLLSVWPHRNNNCQVIHAPCREQGSGAAEGLARRSRAHATPTPCSANI